MEPDADATKPDPARTEERCLINDAMHYARQLTEIRRSHAAGAAGGATLQTVDLLRISSCLVNVATRLGDAAGDREELRQRLGYDALQAAQKYIERLEAQLAEQIEENSNLMDRVKLNRDAADLEHEGRIEAENAHLQAENAHLQTEERIANLKWHMEAITTREQWQAEARAEAEAEVEDLKRQVNALKEERSEYIRQAEHYYAKMRGYQDQVERLLNRLLRIDDGGECI